MNMKTGIYSDISNSDYHSGPGISKTGLDLISQSAGNYVWHKQAPVDEEKLSALDFGTDFHSFFLEPDDFKKTDEWKRNGITAITADDYKKLNQMRDSAMAHPTVKQLMSAQGVAESSVYWRDDETEMLCRCRPDWMISANSGWPGVVIVDVKTTAKIESVEKSIAEFRYHVQDAFYELCA